MKQLKNILLLFMVSILVFTGCEIMPEWVNHLDNSESYSSAPVTVRTNDDGSANISSTNLDADFSLTIEHEGKVVKDYVIEYTEEGSVAILHGYDPLNRYSSFVISGTPDYIKTYFSDSEIESRVLVTGTIVLLIAVCSIAWAEYEFIKSAAKVQTFYYENAVDYYDGGLVLKTTFSEFASDYINPRFSGVMSLVDIGLTFITVGTSNINKATVFSITCDFAQSQARSLENTMVEQAIDAWGITEQNARDSEIYVVVDIDEEDNGFEKMYASYKIYQIDPTLTSFFEDSFEDRNSGDDPDPSCWNLIENGSSDISVIYGDASDGDKSVEFNDGVSDDACYMTAELGSLEKGWIEWDWKVNNVGSFGFQAWSGSSSYSWDNVNFYLNFSDDEKLHYNYSNDLLEESVFDYSTDRWYNMKLYFDCETDTLDLYVNGVKRLRQHSFWNTAGSIEYFRFIAFSNATINGAVVDAVSVIDGDSSSGRNISFRTDYADDQSDNRIGLD